ncbi:aminotransferase class V-fold PLP-dependent enzyme [Roseovarius faecimaris]|uniref:Aminotransferase class V-fold PLP-dependent enzyme n=1 Tax=Roseovarius faecimaris TaxID=2494550 RepID=A0A6I6IVR3_9RHOB|nr:aminotransferase class V-fold PLP-dependent enzyme [Roseovarius faecimaris]QGX96838.1 aminotransferase class V-fold PLP-dependent enzyme [Roseovarius faecimaris]
MDIDALRAETPATADMIHFNNAGASLMPTPVYLAMSAHLALEQSVGGYEAEDTNASQLAAFYTEFAGLLNADPGEIAYVENATRAWDMAFYGLPLKEGDRILTHASEYVSNYLAFLQLKQRRGVEIDLVPSDATGQIDVEAIAGLITPRTRVIAITHVPTQGGLVNPVEEVGRVAREHGLIYVLDACQSVGQIDLDVERIGCDVLSGTGRKYLRGPRGTGFLYMRRALADRTDPPFIDLRAATWSRDDGYDWAPGARRFENWERFMAGQIGLGAAVAYARAVGLPAIEARVAEISGALRAALSDIPGVTLQDQGARKSGIVTFTKDGQSASAIYEALKAQRMNVSVALTTSARLDMVPRGLTDGLTRASVHYFNTGEEVEKFAEAVAQL